MGIETTILEALDAPGGRAYVCRVDGYTFDMGPTVITVPHLGGTGALVRALADRFEALGGTLRCGAEVARIRVDDGIGGCRGSRWPTGSRWTPTSWSPTPTTMSLVGASTQPGAGTPSVMMSAKITSPAGA